jgi:hypothetical protein
MLLLALVVFILSTAGCTTWYTLYIPSLQPVYLSPPPFAPADSALISIDSISVITSKFEHSVAGGYEVRGRHVTFGADGSEHFVTDLFEKLDRYIGDNTYFFIADADVQVRVSRGINPFTLFFYLLFNLISGDSEDNGDIDEDTTELFILRGTVYQIEEKE